MTDIFTGNHAAKNNSEAVLDLLSPTRGGKFFILENSASSRFGRANPMSHFSAIKIHP